MFLKPYACQVVYEERIWWANRIGKRDISRVLQDLDSEIEFNLQGVY